MKTKIEPYYKRQAQDVVDLLFDKGYLNSEIKRDDMRSMEEYIAFLFQTRCEMAVKADRLLRKLG